MIIEKYLICSFNKKLTNDIFAATDQSIPNITSSKKNSNLPPLILNMIKKRKEIRARIHKINQASDKIENNKIKKEINLTIGKKVDQSWNKFLKKCGRLPLSAKPFRKRINNFRSNQTNKKIPTLIQGNSNFDTDLEKANAFGDMLEEIFNDNNNTSFDENFKKKIEKENSNFNYSNKNQQYDQILPVDVVLAIKELPLGPGPDDITNEMLKHLPANIINQITNLANKCLRDCYLPSEWKTAQVNKG